MSTYISAGSLFALILAVFGFGIVLLREPHKKQWKYFTKRFKRFGIDF